MNIGYVRVSTEEQNEQRQIEGLEKYKIEKWFIEKASAKDMNRPRLNELIDFAREGDSVYIHDFSRIARNTKDLLALVDMFSGKGVFLVSNKENIDTSTPTGKLLVTMIGAINEFERQNMLERQREGIAIAKREGKFKGRKQKTVNNISFGELYNRYMKREISKKEMANTLHISRPTLDKLIKQHVTNMIKKDSR